MNYFYLLLGLAVLVYSGDLLVKGAVGIALKLNITPLIVGLTVVSFGTSAPELFASIKAANFGNPEIAIGNVVGSNIANLALVLGITAMIFPVAVARKILKKDWMVMVYATVLFFILSLDGELDASDGVIFIVSLVGYLGYLYYVNKKSVDEEEIEGAEEKAKTFFLLSILLLAGFIGLYFGAEWFLKGAISIAEDNNIDDYIIGVTVVAFGTSVPELATSAIAAYRKHSDISIGNLIGSNIFNIFAVLGITSTIKPLPVPDEVLTNNIYWMLGIALILFPMIYFNKSINRWNGFLLFGLYVSYIGILIYTNM